jgi:formamidopyrimidine-DNA glycosylase
VDLLLQDGVCLRLRDPRRFGALLWTDQPPLTHPLLAHLGPEPLSDRFSGAYLHRLARQRRIAIKTLIMDAKVVVGIGNIYANESLFLAGIDPLRPCNRISQKRLDHLVRAIKRVLGAAIAQGGTTLRDFQREDGSPGYFAISLQVYGKNGQPCPRCGRPIRQRRIGQRASYYCTHCQR